ncbi:MAG: site-specific integrase [Thalassolituus sp.]|jgi:integrase
MASDNLILRGGNWYVRLSVPADVRPILSRREYTASLKTGSKQEAQRLKLPFLSAWRNAIAEARGLSPDLEEKQREGAYLASQEIEQFLKESAMKAALGKNEDFVDSYTELAKKINLPLLARQSSEEVFEYFKTRLDGEANIQKIVHHLHVMVNLFKMDIYHSQKLIDPNEVKGILKDPSHYRAKSPITVTRLGAFEEYQLRRGIVAKTVDTQLSRLKKLKAWLEENQRELNHEGVETYLDTLDCANKTKKQHLFAGNSFWKWAIKKDKTFKQQHQEQANPFENQHLEEVRGVRKKERKAFSVGDIQKLHQSAQADPRRQALANLIFLGAYSGARIEELCQLKTDDIVTEDGVQCLFIRDGKTRNAERIVPVHKDLKPLIKRLAKDAEGEFLLPSSGKNKYGNRSGPLSTQFGRLKKDLGYGEEHVFHSLRKSFITFLQNNEVPGLTIASIVGHETGTITFDVYSAGPNAKQKLKAISTLKIF